MHKLGSCEKEKKKKKRWQLIVKGENCQIPHFGKICGKLALFRKYLTIYHFFITQVSQNRVLNGTQVYKT